MGIELLVGICLLTWVSSGFVNADSDYEILEPHGDPMVELDGNTSWRAPAENGTPDVDEVFFTTTVAENEARDRRRREDDGERDEREEGDTMPPSVNLIATHDSSSPQYEKNCTACHAATLTEESLDPSLPGAHVAMFSFAPGKPGENNQCVWCHRTVDLTQGTQLESRSKGSQRKHVDPKLCALCHGPSGLGRQFYQSELSPTDLGGAALYELSCAACHGNLANSEVRGESADEIQEEIDEDEGGMRPLGDFLSAEAIQAIADALAE